MNFGHVPTLTVGQNQCRHLHSFNWAVVKLTCCDERLESVRMNFSSKLESVRIGKCQNWKVSELESVRIGKCQTRKVSELESVRIGKCQNWKVSESESVGTGKCQNRKVSERESVRIF